MESSSKQNKHKIRTTFRIGVLNFRREIRWQAFCSAVKYTKLSGKLKLRTLFSPKIKVIAQ